MALYSLIAFIACTIGACTGFGGGVFMKPLIDMIGDFDVSSASMLSAITVFCMSAVSIIRQRKNKERPEPTVAISLAIGAACGGIIGTSIFKMLVAGFDSSKVTLIQNIVLAIAVLMVFIYMANKGKVKPLGCKGVFAGAVIGLILGIISSFLGIGGGPINVSLIVFCFGYSTKQAALCSLFTIMCSQCAKIFPMLVSGKLSTLDLRALPFMVAGAILGALIGSAIAKKISTKHADTLFFAANALVFGICVINIIRMI